MIAKAINKLPHLRKGRSNTFIGEAMTNDTSELEALKARVKELEAAPGPGAGWGGLISLIGSVVAIVPRWLVVAAGVVFVAWLGFELYLNAWQKLAQTEQVDAEAKRAVMEKCAATGSFPGMAVMKNADAMREWRAKDKARRPECYVTDD